VTVEEPVVFTLSLWVWGRNWRGWLRWGSLAAGWGQPTTSGAVSASARAILGPRGWLWY